VYAERPRLLNAKGHNSMSFQAMAWAIKQELDTPIAKLLLVMIANYAGDDGTCYPSQKLLAIDCACTDRAVGTWLATFEERGLISREDRYRPDGSQTTDLIRLHLPPEMVSGGPPKSKGVGGRSDFTPLTSQSNQGKINNKKDGPTDRVWVMQGSAEWEAVTRARGGLTPPTMQRGVEYGWYVDKLDLEAAMKAATP
jgi:hypothetical protein